MIDEDEEDFNNRLVLADALDEIGDPRAAGYRWLGENRKRAVNQFGAIWYFGAKEMGPGGKYGCESGIHSEEKEFCCCVDRVVIREMNRLKSERGESRLFIEWWSDYKSRQGAEDTFALALHNVTSGLARPHSTTDEARLPETSSIPGPASGAPSVVA
jgi:hypothetical protein